MLPGIDGTFVDSPDVCPHISCSLLFPIVLVYSTRWYVATLLLHWLHCYCCLIVPLFQFCWLVIWITFPVTLPLIERCPRLIVRCLLLPVVRLLGNCCCWLHYVVIRCITTVPFVTGTRWVPARCLLRIVRYYVVWVLFISVNIVRCSHLLPVIVVVALLIVILPGTFDCCFVLNLNTRLYVVVVYVVVVLHCCWFVVLITFVVPRLLFGLIDFRWLRVLLLLLLAHLHCSLLLFVVFLLFTLFCLRWLFMLMGFIVFITVMEDCTHLPILLLLYCYLNICYYFICCCSTLLYSGPVV